MTRTRAILAATSIAAAAALLVAGCDGDEPAKPSPEPTATSAGPEPSPSVSSVVVAPERPQAMDNDGPAGAEAAAVYFLELDDYIMKTGDTAEWEAMSQKSCEYCANRLKQAEEIASKGYRWNSKPTSARVTHTYEQDSSTGIWPIDVEVAQGAVTLTDSNDKVLYDEDAIKIDLSLEVTRMDDRWVMVGVGNSKDA
ncbi:DUF6318 family protein [Isoptericola sp. NPDC057559]|uniref:DUF6318 family protein n=1 Tax=Isoptericola sp. NPDC057559 TaxID=3346168 RepID=UPI0036973FC7